MESWGKQFGHPWLTFHPQQGDHHVGCISEEGLNPSLYDLGLERSQSDTLLHHNQLIDDPLWGTPSGTFNQSLHPLRGTAVPCWQERSHITLVVDHGVERWSISLSQISLIILPIVQVPMAKGTLCPNLDSSGTIRNTASSSYPAIPRTCMRRMTNLSGLVRFAPNPIRFNG